MTTKVNTNRKFVEAWAKAMEENCGPTVLDIAEGKTMTWTEALAQEVYGTNYKTHAGFIGMKKNLEKGLDIPSVVVERAKEWAEGSWPSWVKSGEYTVFNEDSAVFSSKHPMRINKKEHTDKIVYRTPLNIKF